MDPTTQRLMMASNNKQPFLSKVSYSSNLILSAFKLDSNNNAYICGKSTSPNKAILVKVRYGISGAVVEWARSIVTAGGESYSDVAVSSDDASIYVVGQLSNGSGLTKYNSSGTLQWSRYLQGAPNAYRSVTVDSAGDVYITGHVIISGDTENNVFIAKYNSSGTLQWQKYEQYYDASFDSYGTSIASVPSSGGFVITGYVQQNGEVPDILVTKFSTAGNVVWKRTISTVPGDEYGESIGIDSAGDVYVLGSTNGQGAGSDDMYLIKLSGLGFTSWQRSLGSASSQSGRKIYVDSSTGDCYIAGESTSEVIIAKYNSSGTLQWQRSVSASSAFGISLGPGQDKMLYLLFNTYFLRIDSNGNGTFLLNITNYTDSARTLFNSLNFALGGGTTFIEASASGLITEAGETVTISDA